MRSISRYGQILGWLGVWLIFLLFNLMFFFNRVDALIWLTLVSLPPIWVITVIGGSMDIKTMLDERKKRERTIRAADNQGSGK